MHLYIEVWNARPSWGELPAAERERFFGVVGQQIGAEIDAGCELVAVARNDGDTPHDAGYAFMAVWEGGDGARPRLRGGVGQDRLVPLFRASQPSRGAAHPGRLHR